jgi:two-component system, NarL family, response regulator DevR
MSDTRAVTAHRVASGTSPIRILLVDDHAIVREGLRAVLEHDPALTVVAEAGNGEDALAAEGATDPDVVLLDLKLSARSDAEGLDLLRTLLARNPQRRVLVLTTFLEERLVVEAIQAGAKGYVLKDTDGEELGRAIRAVHAGESAFDPHSAAAVVRSLHGGGRPERPRFSGREQEILEHLAQGTSNKAIGKKLYISESTVKFHVGNIMRKLEVTRRAEAVYAATKLGLI